MLLGLMLQNLVFVAVALYGWRRRGLSPADVGATLPGWRQVRVSLTCGIALFVVALCAGRALNDLLQCLLPAARYAELVRYDHASTAPALFARLAASPAERWGFVLIGSIVAPIGEEALFRGLIYRSLRRRWGVWAGVCLSAGIFALVHVGPLAMGVIFIIGVALALAYERTGSLWTPAIMHAVNNGLMFALLWPRH